MLHLLWELIQGVLFLLDLLSILIHWRLVLCVIVALPIALAALFQSADQVVGIWIAIALLSAGFAGGLVWESGVEKRLEKRQRRIR